MSKNIDPQPGDTVYWHNIKDGVFGGTVHQRIGDTLYFKENVRGGWDDTNRPKTYERPYNNLTICSSSVFYDSAPEAFRDYRVELEAANREANGKRKGLQLSA